MRASAAEQRHALPGELPLAQDALRVEAHEHVHGLLLAALGGVTDDERAAQRAGAAALLLTAFDTADRVQALEVGPRRERVAGGDVEALPVVLDRADGDLARVLRRAAARDDQDDPDQTAGCERTQAAEFYRLRRDLVSRRNRIS
jgi:hypothetical protein